MNAEVVPLPNPGGLPASLKPLLLLIGIAMAVAAGVTVVLWSRGPTYSLLYANLGAEDQAQITQALDAAQIPYRMAPGSSTIEVPSERLNDARLKLAGQGLPQGGGGFAMMDKDPGFGVSQFMENARYQHALEAELARTIAALRPVEGARVHLAVPRQTAFVRDRKGASASVFLQLKQGRRLEQEQIQAIVNLVASSIPDLDANQVTVVDQQGRLLSSPEGHDQFAIREQQYDMIHRLEDDYAQRIEALLAPLVGPGRVRAQVVAQMDMTSSEEAHEQYKPDSQIVRSEQTSEQISKDGSGTQGVPGALTNQPPAAGVAQPPASATAPQAKPNNPAAPAAAAAAAAAAALSPVAGAAGAASTDSSSRSTTRNYEIDRTLNYTRQPAGRLRRLTVAVLIDNVRNVGKDGKVTETPLSSEQLERVNQLVKDAVGFDESRGDNINVVNASFTQETPAANTAGGELEKAKIWESPLARDLAKIVAGLVVLLVLVLSVLRPLVRTLLEPVRNAPQMSARVVAETAATPATPLPPAQSAEAAHEQQIVQARGLVNQDPKRVAQVVRGWVAADE
ncbi:MAG: flagellar M-ring protein FliF [Sinobacteraceae bacterium]|nr:flagellar M-ring protein FliF [Nevskiaceae bacterium]MBV9914276.1 flagellar M-ring protein FliF [Nevskiaceae bacterium]